MSFLGHTFWIFQLVDLHLTCLNTIVNNLFPVLLGSHLDWSGCFLWIYHVWHPSNHQKGSQWWQGLCCPLLGPVHWLCSNFQKGSHSSYAEGNNFVEFSECSRVCTLYKELNFVLVVTDSLSLSNVSGKGA